MVGGHIQEKIVIAGNMMRNDIEYYLEALKFFGYDKIADKISLLWGTPELGVYMSDLMIMDHNNRQGFKPEVFDVLMKIFSLHNKN